MARKRNVKTKSKGYITSRQGPEGIVTVAVTFFLFIMVLMSLYSIVMTSGHAAAWMMLVFFGIPLMFVLSIEDNAFPNLEKRKYKSIILFYFTALIVIPFAVSVFVSFNVAVLIIFVIFFIPLAISAIHLFSREQKWNEFRKTMHDKRPKIKSKRLKKVTAKFKKKKKRKLKRNR